MVNSVREEVTPDNSEQRTMASSICDEPQSEHIKNTITHSELPQRETNDFQDSEKSSNEEQKGHSSDFANGLSIVVSSALDNPQQSQNSDFANGLTIVVSSASDNLHQEQNIGTGIPLLQSGKSIPTPLRYPVKALEDGYNWRKYGQKLVKGNEFVRSYYRCTHPSCRSKRQVERSHDGRLTDTVYIGKHDHDKPPFGSSHVPCFSVSPMQSKPNVGPLAMEEEKSAGTTVPASHEANPVGIPHISATSPTENVLDCSNSRPLQPKLVEEGINHDGDPLLKRQKRDPSNVGEFPVEKPYAEPRFVGEPKVVQTMSEVDLLQDGYRWRKYGQKLVKGNPNPRSYYRCSSSGCPAKKHVERAPHDPKLVNTTYEGQHDHDMPPARTVTPNKGGSIVSMTAPEEEIRPKAEENTAVGLDMVVHISAN